MHYLALNLLALSTAVGVVEITRQRLNGGVQRVDKSKFKTFEQIRNGETTLSGRRP